jgi:hypothetical protein
MKARRIAGWILITLGAGLVALAGMLAIFLASSFLEWRNALGGLSAIALVIALPCFAGLALAAIGRLLCGSREAQPLAHATRWTALGLGAAGLAWAVVLALGALPDGFGPEDGANVRGALVALVAGGVLVASTRVSEARRSG